MRRSPDTEFRGTFRIPVDFEDLTERRALKLTSMLRATGPAHYQLWAQALGGPHFREHTGEFIPIYALDMSITDEPIETREPLDVEVTIRLAKELDATGGVRRLVSAGTMDVYAPRADGSGRACVGRMHKDSVFTRPGAEPGRRRVTRLHPLLNLDGDLPHRTVTLPVLEAVGAAPPGATVLGELADGEPHVWSYQQTDPNEHVHAMDYVRTLDTFAVDQLAHRGHSPLHYFFDRAEVVYRKPCFTGDFYVRRGTLARTADGTECVATTLTKIDPDSPPPESPPPPAVAVRFWIRPREEASRV